MAKRKSRNTNKKTGGGGRATDRLGVSQSTRFINALNGYMLENGLCLRQVADACEVPLALATEWFSLTTPFNGTISKTALTRFCANMHIGRDRLMGYSPAHPILNRFKIDLDDEKSLDDMPEYIREGAMAAREAAGKDAGEATVPAGDDGQGDSSPAARQGAKEEMSSDALESNQPQVESPAVPSAGQEEASPLPSLPAVRLSPFERAIVTLLREHDAARGKAGPGRPDAGAFPQEEHDELERLLSESAEALNAANAKIAELEKSAEADGKALRRKDGEIKRLRSVADTAGRVAARGQGYESYIERDPLFTKRNLTPMDVFRIADELWADALVFTKKAVADLRAYQGDAYELLAAVRALAIPVNDFMHKDEPLDPEALRKVCGFEIALHESERTAADKRCRQERTVSYQGKDVFYEKHLKAGHGSDSLRIYFDFDREAKCVVIGRCGAHLTCIRTKNF